MIRRPFALQGPHEQNPPIHMHYDARTDALGTPKPSALLPLFGYDIDSNGVRVTSAVRAATSGDAAEYISRKIQDDEDSGGDPYASIVITIRRVNGQ